MLRRLLATGLATLACLQAACTVPVRPDHLAQPDKRSLGRIAIVAAKFQPAYRFDALVGGQDAGRRAQQIIDPLDLQGMVLAAVARYAKETGLDLVRLPEPAGPATPAEELLYAQSKGFADTIVEFSVMEAIAVSARGNLLRVGLGMQVRVRVVGVRDGKEMDRLIVRTGGGSGSPEAWLADNAKAVRPAFESSAALAAEQALDEILLIYHPAMMVDKASGGGTERVPPYALRAIEPPIRNKVYGMGRMTMGHLERYPLASLQPEFRWEAWPRGFDIAPGDRPGQARDVRYDLRIMGTRGMAYKRRGLRESAHRLEQPLEPCGHYRWTVRARFVLNGAPRATEWMGAFDTMGGPVAPWWFRRGSGAPALAIIGNPTWYFPIVETPSTSGDACPGQAAG